MGKSRKEKLDTMSSTKTEVNNDFLTRLREELVEQKNNNHSFEIRRQETEKIYNKGKIMNKKEPNIITKETSQKNCADNNYLNDNDDCKKIISVIQKEDIVNQKGSFKNKISQVKKHLSASLPDTKNIKGKMTLK
ncbi:hypothetical protein [Citrobacter sp. JGM124]|uniref:hypothetical protein n=1 Tax=Citrobacter sp. JGM124 TaxID=2799789 RepID=UPI001BAD05FA|nr:hypothetical protein [Citrobacter sp. JGM124]MBS0849969.1 hypothetical protein [Citrobacter sp. JGM124]